MRCFLISDKTAVEIENLVYNKINRTVICNDTKCGNTIKVDADKVVIIDGDTEMKIFREEYNII